MDFSVKAVHFQLTARCNLNCTFCGQRKGMLDDAVKDMEPDFFLRCASELAPGSCVTLWGGEPLLYREFDRLATELHEKNLVLDIVTNGTLIDRRADVLNSLFRTIYVSVDGPEKLHDAIRGQGVFARLERNLPLLRERKGELVFLCTVSDANVDLLPELPGLLACMGADRIILQQLMFLSSEEIETYRAYSREHFHCDYPALGAFRRDDGKEYLAKLDAGLALLKKGTPVPVEFYPHRADGPACRAPECRLHVGADGEVGFCTDYYGFSIGNARNSTLKELLNGERAALWRQAVAEHKLPICDHCAWRTQDFT